MKAWTSAVWCEPARNHGIFEVAICNLKPGRGGRRFLPYVFTEKGVAMLSTVLNSEQAIEVNVHIMRAFVKLR